MSLADNRCCYKCQNISQLPWSLPLIIQTKPIVSQNRIQLKPGMAKVSDSRGGGLAIRIWV